MATTSLVKTILYKSLAEGVYQNVVTRSSSYFYFLGKTLSWNDENVPENPVDSLNYEHEVRNEIITIKEIKPSDVAFVVDRKDWASDVVYDMYDDRLCDEVLGINLISGGAGYINIEDIQISITGGGGTGATAAVSEIVNGAIAGIVLLSPGTGYTSVPQISITSVSGTGAEASVVIGMAKSGAQKIEDANFYVVTDEYNVYKCLDNNNGAYSTNKPTGTQLEPITTADGYVWKFMYNIPINLRNKFYTDEYIPVVSALTTHFYSNGTIDNIFITNRGVDYSTALVSVLGDGYKESDPLFITQAQIAEPGTGYTNPTVTFSPPIGTASPFVAGNNVNLGQTIYNTSTSDYYEIVTPGILSSIPPTHRDGTVLNGTTALKYVGTTLKGTLETVNNQNLTSIDLDNPGAGYTSAPTVTITDSTGIGASAQAIIGTSLISGLTIVSGGSNYVSPLLTIAGGGGSGATAIATVTSGVITNVQLITAGSGYTSVPTVIIEDPSGLGANITASLSGSPVQQINLITKGSGYTNPTVTITGGGGAGATASANVETGVLDSVVLNGSVREIVMINSGSGYNTAPAVTFSGGGGNYAAARSKLYADRVISTHIVDQGINYTSAPDVYFGTQWAKFMEVYTNDQVYNNINLYTVVDNGFFGSIAPTWASGTQITSPLWVSTTSVTAGDTVYVQDTVPRMYEVMTTGYTGAYPPTHTSGTVSNGGVSLRYIGKPASLRRDGTIATGYAVLRYGAGYSATPLATITDSTGTGGEINFLTTKSEARVSAITENGQIVYVVIDDPGVGYTKASLTVSGDGEGASLVADLSLGAISSQQANNEILTPAGTIDAIAVISGGYSYGVANIAIEGDGSGASAEAVIDPITNSIVKINITNRGEGYTYANVKVVGNGNGATLRAIISPFGGHGKNSPEELYSRSLMFYSNISNDLNQGTIVNNDYRQVGIIKDPRVFDGFERYQGTIGSACFIIQSPINPVIFSRDDDLYIERTTTPEIEWTQSLPLTIGQFLYYEDRIYTVVVSGLGGSTPPTTTTGSETNGFAVLTYVGSTKSKKRYRIISLTETSVLVQSLDSDIPQANDVFIQTNNITNNFTAITVGLPNFDKFSGQLMYIDNKQGFTPSGDETITLRTIIRF